MKRVLVVILLLVLMLFMFGTSCVPVEKVPVENHIAVMHNDLANGKLVLVSQVDGFTFTREYSTDYDASRWRITDSKDLIMRAWASDTDADVFVEHMHADVSIKASWAGLDGIKQDTMDDSVHAGDQVGFWINSVHPYENVFAIEGYTQTLISGWQYYWSGWGYGKVEQVRLTEDNLIANGVYGTKIQIVYDLMIRNKGDQFYHTRSIIDEILIPLGNTTVVH